MTKTYWDKYDETLKREETIGGGIVAKVNVETGYKAYISGLDQASTFFPARAGEENEPEQEVAKAKCHALGSRANWGIQIRAFLEGALSRGKFATWNGDQFFNVDGYTDAAKQVVYPSFKDAGLSGIPWEGYARIGFKPDPHFEAQGEEGMTDTDQDGKPRFPRVAYIVETLTDQEYKAATDAAGEPALESIPFEGPAVPSEWRSSPDGWKKQVAKIKSGLQNPDALLPALRAEVEEVALALVAQYIAEDKEPTLKELGGTVDEIVAWLPEVEAEG